MVNRLGLRSSYSFLWGTSSPQKLVAYLAKEGCKTIGITDRNNLYGLFTIRQAAKEAHMNCIIGCELTSAKGSIFVFVSSAVGFSNLCMLLYQKALNPSFDVVASLAANNQGLVITTASATIVEQLSSKVAALYGAITPRNMGIIPTARRLALPLAAIDDASFISEEDYSVHRVLRAIALQKTVGTLQEDECAEKESVVLSYNEYKRILGSWGEALDGTQQIVNSCSDVPLFDTLVFPDYPSADTELQKRVIAGAEKRYGELSDALFARIEYELHIIIKKGFAPYFLVMDDIVQMASRTCGRGSAAASIVAYSLGITNVDPIAHNLYFERFLTLSRTDPPDIDVDFAWDERDGIIQRVIERFGTEHCARVANHNRFQWRSAVKESAKAYGFSLGEIERMLKKGSQAQWLLEPWKTVLHVAKRIEGLPRGLSMHCGGLVITKKRVATYAPVEFSLAGYPLLGWDKEGVEEASLVKIDLLGNRSLAVIRDTLANLRSEGIIIDQRMWKPIDDVPTQQALASGDTMGVFYIESPAMRQLQKKSGKGDFEHIVIHSSMIRPAANTYINEYLRRLKGGSWHPLHPRLATILQETYGILCYQEDVSKVAVALGGFSEEQADALRKVISKKTNHQRLSAYEQQFKSGCAQNGVDATVAATIWTMMLSFDGYSFCKPHSASYAMVSFQSAYLKVHHKAAFMAAVLTNRGGYYSTQAYVSEARRMGIPLYGPDINRSKACWYAEGDTIIVGLQAIANLSDQTIAHIVSQRALAPFYSLAEVPLRVKLQRQELVSLCASGAFDSISAI
ncbi:MAG: DNA polymerase III subunit alpha [Sphaerochaetaceae bacterium]